MTLDKTSGDVLNAADVNLLFRNFSDTIDGTNLDNGNTTFAGAKTLYGVNVFSNLTINNGVTVTMTEGASIVCLGDFANNGGTINAPTVDASVATMDGTDGPATDQVNGGSAYGVLMIDVGGDFTNSGTINAGGEDGTDGNNDRGDAGSGGGGGASSVAAGGAGAGPAAPAGGSALDGFPAASIMWGKGINGGDGGKGGHAQLVGLTYVTKQAVKTVRGAVQKVLS